MTAINFFKSPPTTHIYIALGTSLFLAGITHGFVYSCANRPSTMSDQFQKGNKEYMKFQKMNPIFGISKGL